MMRRTVTTPHTCTEQDENQRQSTMLLLTTLTQDVSQENIEQNDFTLETDTFSSAQHK